MNRCGIKRKDGVVRIGILCDDCAARALRILGEEQRGFWVKSYQGPESCEGCHMDEYNDALLAKETVDG